MNRSGLARTRIISHFSALLTVALVFASCVKTDPPAPTPSSSPSSRPSPSPSVSPQPADTTTATVLYRSADAVGPNAVSAAEYRFPAVVDPEVLPGTTIEVWAKLYRPTTMGSARHPLLIFLHGNHVTCSQGSNPTTDASCQYTFTGSCPTGQDVVPNHLGYEYLANRMASWGYVVVSINANRGITCGNSVQGDDGLNLARGRLILRHLALLSNWDTVAKSTPASLGVDLKGMLDFGQVGLLGHSRAGEGVRAAYNLYKDSGSLWQKEILEPLNIRGIFEIGPVDGQTSRVLDAMGTAWNALLPMCDGDVNSLAGMKPYDRMSANVAESTPLPKSLFAVWGANHNYYNTQWQTSDSAGCIGMSQLWTGTVGSIPEQNTALAPVLAFFRANVGASTEKILFKIFDPRFALPTWLNSITRVDRTFLPSPDSFYVFHAETFQGGNGIGTLGAPQQSSNVAVTTIAVPEHAPTLLSAQVSWQAAGDSTYFQDNWTAAGHGLNLSAFQTLDFRAGRALDNTLNASSDTNFGIQLVRPDGSLGPQVMVATYASLVGPVGALVPQKDGSNAQDFHSTLQTVRIPLADLGGLSSAAGVRFTFNATASGNIYLADLNLSTIGSDPWSTTAPSTSPVTLSQFVSSLGTGLQSLAAAMLPQRPLSRSPASFMPSKRVSRMERSSDSTSMEVEVEGSEPFPVRDALPVLYVNGRETAVGNFPTSGDLKHMIFRVPGGPLPPEADLNVGHREDPAGNRYHVSR